MSEESRFLLLLDRFRHLPALTRETWQGGIVRLPAWIEHGPGNEPFRPWGVIWVSLSTGRMTIKIEPEPDAHGPELVLEALVEFAQQEKKVLGGRAGRLHVADHATREHLQEAVGDSDSSIEVVPRLDAVADVLREYTKYAVPDPPPAALDGPGVTVDAMREFAAAAARFYQAAPWQYLTDEDLIRIESPAPPSGYEYAVVLGHGRHTFGLGFYRSSEQHAAMMGGVKPGAAADETGVARSVIFDSGDGIPFADHDLWIEHDLPLAGPRAYPFAAHYYGEGEASRPGREDLAFLEAIMRALAETTEDEMDSGRWSKRVTAKGRATEVRLVLPGLLEPGQPGAHVSVDSRRRASERVHADIRRFLDAHEFQSIDEANRALSEHFVGRPRGELTTTPSTPLERAQDLAYQAYEFAGRRRVVLAKQALAISLDCAEAYVILAERAPTPERALELYEKAVAAGRRAIGEKFDALVGGFWGHVETRPYMRARLELAQTLEEIGRRDEAIGHYEDLLRLNPSDNQGVRYLLVPRLIQAGRDGEAAAILQAYPDDIGATLRYAAALCAFRKSGDSPEAQRALADAMKWNRFVPQYLLDPLEDESIDHFELRSEEEAIVCGGELHEAWCTTPGALDWLRQRLQALRAANRKRAKGGRKRKRKG